MGSSIWMSILQIVIFSVIVLVAYNILKIYVLVKIKVNKFVIFGISIVVFFILSIVPPLLKINIQGSIWSFVTAGVFIILFLWAMDIHRGRMVIEEKGNSTYVGKKSKNDNVKIRPKAKPNRVKNINKE